MTTITGVAMATKELTDKPKKARRKLSLKDRVAELDRKIVKSEARTNVLKQRRSSLIAEARAALNEVEGEA